MSFKDVQRAQRARSFEPPPVQQSSGRRRESIAELSRNDLSKILMLSSRIFSHIDDMDETISVICDATNGLLNVDKNTLWLFDPFDDDRSTLFAKVFDKELCPALSKSQLESVAGHRKISAKKGIAGWVATNGKLVTLNDVYEDDRFNPTVDLQTGYKSCTMLTVPIRCNTSWKEIVSKSTTNQAMGKFDVPTGTQESFIIGVLQLVNKLPTPDCFTTHDEALAMLLADYIGIALNNCISYRKMVQAQLQANIVTDMLFYHHKLEAGSVEETVEKAESEEFLSLLPPDYKTFSFSPRLLENPEDIVPFIVHLFIVRDCHKRLKVQKSEIATFVRLVRQSYRKVPYHNFAHAASVCHAAFAFLEQCDLEEKIGHLACDMLLLSALTHDMDHRGTNNSFQTICESDLACLYSSEGSILERHHLSQTLGLLSSPGCQLLKHLSPDKYNEAVDLITHIILSTDLANHFKNILPKLPELTENFDPENLSHCKTLISLLATACDLSQISKPFGLSAEISNQIYSEFHTQGDLEKAHGRAPIRMMDREKCDVLAEQVNFLDKIALPVYKTLSQILPGASPAYEAALSNRNLWENKRKEEK